MKTKMGRPEKPENEQRNQFFTVRFTKDEMEQIKAKIKESGCPKSQWGRGKLLG